MHKELRSIKTVVGAFFELMEREVSKKWPIYTTWDENAVAAFVKPAIVQEEKFVYATVELKGDYTRGQMVIDWAGRLKRSPNVTIVTKLDSKILYDMIRFAMHYK